VSTKGRTDQQGVVGGRYKKISQEKGTFTIPTKSGDIILTAYVFSESNLSNNLAGLSNLTNLQCTVTLTATTITISRGDEIIWSGTKDCDEKLWNLNLADLKKKLKNYQQLYPFPRSQHLVWHCKPFAMIA
jgi:hypothetical protein